MPYHVYIERPRETSALAVARVAAAIAARYGLPQEAISQRLAQGRFRVKASVDLDGARRVAADLESLGAVCTIEDAATGARVPAAGAAPPAPPTAPAKPPAAPPKLPPPKPAAAPASILPPAPASARPVPESALSAALAGGSQQDLGAIGDGTFALSALDGSEEPVRPAAQAPPSPGRPAARPAIGDGPPADLFAPPEAQEQIELAVEARPSQKRPVTPPPAAPGAEQAPSQRMPAAPSPGPAPAAPAAPDTDLAATLEDRPVARFAVGVALALVAGLAPAWLFASVREGSAYDAPRAELQRAHEEYTAARPASAEELQALNATLDKVRADQGALLDDARSGVALFAGLIWLGVAGAVGYLWIRKFGW